MSISLLSFGEEKASGDFPFTVRGMKDFSAYREELRKNHPVAFDQLSDAYYYITKGNGAEDEIAALTYFTAAMILIEDIEANYAQFYKLETKPIEKFKKEVVAGLKKARKG